jgi:fumarylpyruvate hydrolase
MTSAKPTSPPEHVALPIVDSDDLFYVRRIYCVGRNFVSHIREMAEADERDDPFFFQKPRDAVVQNGGSVRYPSSTDSFEYEGELVIAIGTAGSDITAADADKHVFGAACGLDMTRRDLQFAARERSWPWEMGKAFDESAPVGAVSRIRSLAELDEGKLELQVNGDTKQQTELSLMIWSPAEIVARLSAQYRLEPGDIIMTGTPAGVGQLAAGDTVHLEITGLTTLDITVSS